MGRLSRRAQGGRKAWETRRLNLQTKVLKFQTKAAGEDMAQEALTIPVQETLIETGDSPTILIKKITGRRGRPKGTFKKKIPVAIPAPTVNFDALTKQIFTYDQIQELGVKAIYDGHGFRLLKQNGHVILAG